MSCNCWHRGASETSACKVGVLCYFEAWDLGAVFLEGITARLLVRVPRMQPCAAGMEIGMGMETRMWMGMEMGMELGLGQEPEQALRSSVCHYSFLLQTEEMQYTGFYHCQFVETRNCFPSKENSRTAPMSTYEGAMLKVSKMTLVTRNGSCHT